MKFKFLPHIAVQVDDLSAAKKFYTEVLGMGFIAENNMEAKLTSGDATFYVEEDKSHRVYFSFEVDSLSEAKKLLVDNACIITSESPDGMMVDDPHGLSYFVSEIQKAK